MLQVLQSPTMLQASITISSTSTFKFWAADLPSAVHLLGLIPEKQTSTMNTEPPEIVSNEESIIIT